MCKVGSLLFVRSIDGFQVLSAGMCPVELGALPVLLSARLWYRHPGTSTVPVLVRYVLSVRNTGAGCTRTALSAGVLEYVERRLKTSKIRRSIYMFHSAQWLMESLAGARGKKYSQATF